MAIKVLKIKIPVNIEFYFFLLLPIITKEKEDSQCVFLVNNEWTNR